MNALHYAAFFDIPEIVNILAKENPGKLSLSAKITGNVVVVSKLNTQTLTITLTVVVA